MKKIEITVTTTKLEKSPYFGKEDIHFNTTYSLKKITESVSETS